MATKVKHSKNELAMKECMLFALNSFKDGLVFDFTTGEPESWQKWFIRVMGDAGFRIEPAEKPEKKKRRATAK